MHLLDLLVRVDFAGTTGHHHYAVSTYKFEPAAEPPPSRADPALAARLGEIREEMGRSRSDPAAYNRLAAEYRRLQDETRAAPEDAAERDASAAATLIPEPESLKPEPSARVAAAERAASEAEAQYRQFEASLPADLRVRVERELQALQLDADDRAHVIGQGAACLAAAVGV